MKKTISLIAVMMAIVLLLSSCGPKTYTEKDFEGKWKLTNSSVAGETSLEDYEKQTTYHADFVFPSVGEAAKELNT